MPCKATAEFTHIYEKNWDAVYKKLCFLGLSKEDAEDVAQLVFQKYWEYSQTHEVKKPAALLYDMTTTQSKSFLRRYIPRKKRECSNIAGVDGEKVDLFATLPASDDVEGFVLNGIFLQTVLDKLSKEERLILLLRHSQDLQFDDIANELGKPLSTIKTQHQRALKKLRKFAV